MKPAQPEQVPGEAPGRSEAGDGNAPQLEQIGGVRVHAAADDHGGLVPGVARETQGLLVVVSVRIAEHGHRAAEQRAQLLARRLQLGESVRRRESRERRMGAGMRAELDPGRLHGADLARVQQRLLQLVGIPRVRLADVPGHEEDRGRAAVFLEYRLSDRAVAPVAVVERDDDGSPRQPSTAVAVSEIVGERHAPIAGALEKGELRVELLGGDIVPRIARPGRDAVDLVVHEDRQLHAGSTGPEMPVGVEEAHVAETLDTTDPYSTPRSAKGKCNGGMRRLLLALLLQFAGVFLNELLDVIRHREQPEPLLLIERHGVAPQSIDGHSPTLRDLEKRALPSPGAELLVLSLKSLELRMHVVWHTHLLPPTPLADESRPCV